MGALAMAGALIAFHIWMPVAVRWFWATELQRTAPLSPRTRPNTLAPVQVPIDDMKTPQTAAWCGEGWTKHEG